MTVGKTNLLKLSRLKINFLPSNFLMAPSMDKTPESGKLKTAKAHSTAGCAVVPRIMTDKNCLSNSAPDLVNC